MGAGSSGKGRGGTCWGGGGGGGGGAWLQERTQIDVQDDAGVISHGGGEQSKGSRAAQMSAFFLALGIASCLTASSLALTQHLYAGRGGGGGGVRVRRRGLRTVFTMYRSRYTMNTTLTL